ncbi:hypothetical protein K2O51_31550 (plasmid) [Cupriavidus pinatubonensis]|uniref:hypothetical protein n=1 Tax=Cupriavidus pinatubonensis TaxID=248026 RepID=UPI001C737126|nr:hypothetical protein [Cupriavidus pinatubonensis]QYY33567.1 hypothetical protein K2O51_31550 [Cupriavidus pinatubonensis]
MTSVKTWTYAELTTNAEREIENCRQHPLRHEREPMAFGVFILWARLTGGNRDEADADRLEALVKSLRHW